MKSLFPILMTALIALAAGCNEGTPGGPGVKNNPPTSTTSSSTATVVETPDGSSSTVITEKPAAVDDSTTTEKPAAPGTDANPIAGDPENSFRLDAPNLATTIKQGETKVVTIGISRSKNFDQDVTLMLEGVPKGVTIDPAEPMIKHGENEVKLNVAAADDAALNDFTIKLIGHPATGPDATNEFKLTVEKP
ncbi:MAG: hypothetical protein IAF94_00490 [Pirellulaceae bacterium]|nr:hypothetical protein [Pirellulaceae bacterium]